MSPPLFRTQRLSPPVTAFPVDHRVHPTNAFTLLEVLLVAAILTILSSLLIPAFSRIRSSARRSLCQSNLKQLSLAALMYAEDYDGRHVTYTVATERKQQLYPYIRQGTSNSETGTIDVWRCPDNTLTTSVAPAQLSASYGFNTRMNAVLQAAVPQPSETVMAADGGRNDDGSGRTATHLMSPGTMTSTALCRPSFRHFNGAHFSFMDGHVKWMKQGTAVYSVFTVTDGLGNGITDRADPRYQDRMWDLD